MSEDQGNLDSQALTRMGVQMEFLVKEVGEIKTTVQDIVNRVTVMESQKSEQEIEQLSIRLRALEDAHLQQRAVIGVADWLPRYLGWLAAAVAIVWSYVKQQHTGG